MTILYRMESVARGLKYFAVYALKNKIHEYFRGRARRPDPSWAEPTFAGENGRLGSAQLARLHGTSEA